MQVADGTLAGMTSLIDASRLGLGLVAVLGVALQLRTADASPTSASCLGALRSAERAATIPSGLLLAVAMNESGRWDRQRKHTLPWPWTVNNGGDGRHFETKQEAIQWVEDLRRRGRTNIDVGCMQINLHHHPDAFPDLDAAFDPVRNVAYGAKFLGELHDATGSWPAAVGRYHSADSARGRSYSERVYARLQGLDQVITTEGTTPNRRPSSWTQAAEAKAPTGRPLASIGVFTGTGAPRRASLPPKRGNDDNLVEEGDVAPNRVADVRPPASAASAPARFFPLRTAANGTSAPGFFRIRPGS